MRLRHHAIGACGVLLTLALAACGGDGADTTSTSLAEPTATTTATTTAPTTVASSSTAAPAATTTTTAPDPGIVIETIVSNGEVEGQARPAVSIGDDVTIVVTADVTDEVHVHGYDLFADLSPGVPVEIRFSADIPGIFEVELEVSHTLLFELEVS